MHPDWNLIKVPEQDRYYQFVPGVGGHGGKCLCPNSQHSFNAGDNSDSCQSLSCQGGRSGSCSGQNPGGSGKAVYCSGWVDPHEAGNEAMGPKRIETTQAMAALDTCCAWTNAEGPGGLQQVESQCGKGEANANACCQVSAASILAAAAPLPLLLFSEMSNAFTSSS